MKTCEIILLVKNVGKYKCGKRARYEVRNEYNHIILHTCEKHVEPYIKVKNVRVTRI